MMNNELIPTPMMSFGESVKTCFQKYVTFKGRARRSEYWWFCLLNFIVSIVTLVLDYQMDTINIEVGLGALSGLYTLIVFLPGLAVSVRRLHDTGHSGWLYLLLIIPILGSLFLLYFFVSDSAPEENRYGKSPKYAQETFLPLMTVLGYSPKRSNRRYGE